jgi:Small-conductance mechanosensitive channel
MSSFSTFFQETAVSLTDILVRIGVSLLLILIAKLIIIIVKKSLKRSSARHIKFTDLMCQFVTKVLSVIIWLICLMCVLAVWGINLGPVVAGLGITGVVLGFALQESIASLFSGMMLAINNPFRIGDFVDVGGTSGTIQAMDMMSVTMNTPDNKKITMSNKIVWGSVITNFSYTNMRRVDMIVPVAYGSDYDKVRKLVMDLLMSYPETLTNPLPTVEVSHLADSAVNIVARPWVLPDNYWDVYWKFNKDVLNVLTANGIEIPYNKIDINLRTPVSVVTDGQAR